jgi:hypothetical protein
VLTVANLPRVVQEHGTMGTKANGKNAYEGGTTLRHESLPVSRRVKPPAPHPQFTRRRTPAAQRLGFILLRALMHLGAITACLTRIKYVDLQKCYPVKLGEALPWCCIPRPAARDKGSEELRSNGRRLNRVPASLTQEVWAFAHPSIKLGAATPAN